MRTKKSKPGKQVAILFFKLNSPLSWCLLPQACALLRAGLLRRALRGLEPRVRGGEVPLLRRRRLRRTIPRWQN